MQIRQNVKRRCVNKLNTELSVRYLTAKLKMLRPSAFQNNGNSESSTSSKSILRPSSFQLAASSLQAAASTSTTTVSNKSDNDEPTTTSTLDEASLEVKRSISPSSLPGSNEDDGISSTTNNDGENSEKVNSTLNPFNSSKIKNADTDDSESSKKADDVANAASESKSPRVTPTGSVAAALTPTLAGKSLFVPNTNNLFAAATSKNSSIRNGSESNIGFVFGQNIHERIVGAPDSSAPSSADDSKSDSCSGSELFAAAAANSTALASASTSSIVASSTAGTSSSNGTGTDQPKETSRVEDLTKVAREYEESRVQKRKLDAVETFTGEENEVNVLDVNSKLFAFVASNWEERGPGSLRLNDIKVSSGGSATASKAISSRVVFRTSGNFRVLLNTKVWAGMVVEKSSQKSLRLTAIDPSNGQIKIFLAMARPDDITCLYTALKKRIELEVERAAEAANNSIDSKTSSDGEAAGDDSKESLSSDDVKNSIEPIAKKDRKS